MTARDDRHRHRLGHHLVHLRRGLLPLRQPRRAAAQALPGSVLGQFIPVVWLGILGATPGHQERHGRPRRAHRRQLRRAGASPCCCWWSTARSRPTSSTSTPSRWPPRPWTSRSTGARSASSSACFAMAAVVFFIFQADLGSVLDTWLIGIVAWIAAWGGIMLVHYYGFASAEHRRRRPVRAGRHQAPARRQLGGHGRLPGRHRRHLDVPVRPHPGAAGPRGPWPWAASTCPGWPAACRLPPPMPFSAARSHRRYAQAARQRVRCTGVAAHRSSLGRQPSTADDPRSRAVSPVRRRRADLQPGRTAYRRQRPSPSTSTPSRASWPTTRPRAPRMSLDVAPVVRPAGRRAAAAADPRAAGHPRHVLRARASPPSATRTWSGHRRRGPRGRPPRLPARADAGDRRRATEARYLDRGLEALDRVAGVVPVGYRAPWWELNWHTPGLLADRGFLYDSSLLDGDAPYRFAVAAGRRRTPWSRSRSTGRWTTGSSTRSTPAVTGSGVIESPAKAREMWSWRPTPSTRRAAAGC